MSRKWVFRPTVLAAVAACGCASTIRSVPHEDCGVGVPYALPKALISVSLVPKLAAKAASGTKPDGDKGSIGQGTPVSKPSFRDYLLELTVARDLVPDPAQRFLLQIDKSSFSDDDLKVVVGENGLLSSVNATTDDKTVAVVEAFAQGLAVATAPAPGSVASPQKEVVDSTAPGWEESALADLETITRSGGLVGVLDRSNFTSIGQSWTVGEMGGWRLVATSREPAGAPLDPAHCGLEERRLSDEPSCTVRPSGVVVATVRPLVLDVRFAYHWPKDGRTTIEKHVALRRTVTVLVPDGAPRAIVPIASDAFVRSETKLSFSNGILTQSDVTRPSAALAGATLPVRIAEAAVAVPAKIAKLRIDWESGTEDPVEGPAGEDGAKRESAAARRAAFEDAMDAVDVERAQLADVLADHAAGKATSAQVAQARVALSKAKRKAQRAAQLAGISPPEFVDE